MTYEEYFAYYKARIQEKMHPITAENTPEIGQIALAMRNVLKIQLRDKDFEDRLQREYDSLLHALNAQLQAARGDDDDDDNSLFEFLYTVVKVTAIAVVAEFAPQMLSTALPALGAAGSVTNSIATGALVGITDAASQGLGMALGIQGHFSMNEMLESAVSGGVGAGVSDLNALTRAAVVSLAAASTQGAEMFVGMRKEFDPKAIGLQIAASLIASGVKEVAPDLVEKIGAEGAQMSSMVANTVINTALQSAAYNTPIDMANVAANLIGGITGEKIGSKIKSTYTSENTIPETQTQTKNDQESTTSRLPEVDFDKLCAINDAKYLELQKMKSMSPLPSTDDAVQLIMQGKFEEAKKLAIEVGKAKYTPIVDRPINNDEPTKSDARKADAGSLASSNANKGNNTANVLARMAAASNGEPYSFYNKATPLEQIVLTVAGIGAVTLVVPEVALTAANTIAATVATGLMPEAAALDAMAVPALREMTGKLATAIGGGALISKLGLFKYDPLATFIQIPGGLALQSESIEAIAVREKVMQGAKLYRGGKLGRSAGPEGQFWSLENPLSPDYAKKYGLPPRNQNFDFIEVAVIDPKAKFITREAPPVGSNAGGGIEVVVDASTPKLEYFHMPVGEENDLNQVNRSLLSSSL